MSEHTPDAPAPRTKRPGVTSTGAPRKHSSFFTNPGAWPKA